MSTKDKVIDTVLALISASIIALVTYVFTLGNRTTALEHQIVTDTQFMELMHKMDQRLTINETLLQQMLNSVECIVIKPGAGPS